MDENHIKEVLDFLLSSYRAKLAIQNPTENCPFDFPQFLATWKGKYPDWACLKAAMKQNLEPLVQQGIFDSIIPYLSASINQSSARRDEIRCSASVSNPPLLLEDGDGNNGIISTELVTLTQTKRSKRNGNDMRSSGSIEPALREFSEEDRNSEIVIHVCDEGKNLKQDFKCVQSVLIQEMGYFSKVTVRGQKLKDMDISVHCDIAVFDWLMKWVKSKMSSEQNVAPKLEPTNVIGLMVSAEFLQMPVLTEECIQFTARHIEEVILTSPNLGCLNESLTNRLSTYFDNVEMETKIGRVDKSDRITSRLYTQFTMSLNEPTPPSPLKMEEKGHPLSSRGQFSSTATLFKCSSCERLLINDIASRVPCATMRLDCHGRLYSIHTKDGNWSLSNFIRELKRELKTWRRVYWRLWGTVHFLSCSTCQLTFPVKEFTSCRFHPKPPQLQVNVVAATGEIQERNLDLDTDDLNSSSKIGQTLLDEECINPFRRQREKLKAAEKKKLPGTSLDDDDPLETINCAFGVYPCCRKAGYKFYPLPPTNGCQFREHTIQPSVDSFATPILERLSLFKELIIVNPTKIGKGGPTSWTPDYFEWGGILELTPPKPILSSSSTFLPSRFHPKLRDQPNYNSSTEESLPNHSSSVSDTEDANDGSGSGGGGGGLPYLTSNQAISEFWSWNSDFTTRYNQDMQREKEEKLMSDLELMLSQRVSLEASSSSGGASGLRFGYMSRRMQHKNMGGSFIKLEEKWREERGGSKGGGGASLGQGQRTSTAKSGKPSS